MIEKYQQNPTGRFSGLAETYARCRPSYPSDAIDFIAAVAGLKAGSVVVDVGCGTGISSRLFAARGYTVRGIEPNDDMRAKADEALAKDSSEANTAANLIYARGTAEATGEKSASADLIVSAQAFHWFDPAKTLPEFRRILKPEGWVALIWNERDETDEFTEKYGELFRTLPDTAGVEVPRGKAGNALLESDLFDHRQRDLFTSSQLMNEEALVGRAFSASYAPKQNPQKDDFDRSLRLLFHEYAKQYEKDGSLLVKLHYATSVYTAQKPD